jgi:hypothetical protein
VFGITGLPVFLMIASMIFDAGISVPLIEVWPVIEAENRVMNIAEKISDKSFMIFFLKFLICYKSKGKSDKINIFRT